MRGFLSFLAALLAATGCVAAPGYAVWGTFKYAPGFDHFDYVNPQAPKGGELRLTPNSRASTFDKFNPYTLRGQAPSYLGDLMFESLLTGSMDEVGVAYGLLAEDVELASDRMSVTFRLRREARFQNGDPVTAADVKHSYDALNSEYAAPSYASVLADVAGCDVLDDRTVRFRFRKLDRQLPLVVGGLPVFSRKWGMENGKPKRFDRIVTDPPIASGPYKIGPLRWGKDITYVRDPQYWGRDLPVRRGTANFDRITVKIYSDSTAQLEALKAGEFDLMEFFSAGDWLRRLNGKRIASGDLRKEVFEHRSPAGFYSYFLNNRLPKFQDRRVRMAIELALDYEWMNRQLFRGSYTRVKGVFGNTDCEANGTPSPAEVALLEPFRGVLPPETFGPMAVPPRTDQGHSLRDNLRQARSLLAQAGWTYRDGALRNAKGEPFTIELLDSSEGKSDTTVAAWRRALAILGIRLSTRAVDWALFQERLDNRQFDMVPISYPGTHFPGADYVDLFGSKAADTPGSGNLSGIKNPAIDALTARLTQVDNRDDFLATCRALDRVIAHGHYMVPAWTSTTQRVAWSTWRLQRPQQVPPYPPEGVPYLDWPMLVWWARLPPITAKE
ncbi:MULTISPECIES: extracellular solute-binding protein [Ramlibacter]|uniref:ABC transporter substrate-binding protein n=1 Tax=Ramlibacter aquaticus TaxID=2780094 RepID=A0ABR9SFQ8_9BURK|nr:MULTISPECIES: extracellular solute-binding protein [Ramlibacter]MBE7941187.1 ABC transporter substrate-binding protein [Ramlibacter aquaticus]